MKDTYNDGYKTEDIKCIIVDFISEDGKGGLPIMRQGEYILCKDCKYWAEFTFNIPPFHYCGRLFQDGNTESIGFYMEADDFCSRGEKK